MPRILQRKEPWKMKSGIENLESIFKAWSAAWHANFLNVLLRGTQCFSTEVIGC